MRLNYEEDVYAKWEDLPQCRIYLDLGDGGENCWGRELPDGTYALDNYPMYNEYTWQDVVTSKELHRSDQLIHRRWKTRLFYKYEIVGTTHGERLAQRKQITDALLAEGNADPGFWVEGVGTVSFKEELNDEEAQARVQKLLAKVGITPSFRED